MGRRPHRAQGRKRPKGPTYETWSRSGTRSRPGHTARILIGERDDGTVQDAKNADNMEKVKDLFSEVL
jgi:hypothetical protein